MPSLIRANPISGAAEIFHTDSQLYVQAAAIMQVVGGLEVALSTAQANSLSTIANSTAKLSDISADLKDVETKIEQFNQAISGINTSGFAGLIQAVNSNGNGTIESKLTALNTELLALSQTVLGYSAKFDLIRDYSTSIAALSTRMTDVNTSVTRLTGILSPPSNMVCQTIDLTTANTQYSISIPVGTKKIAFGCRGDRGLNDIAGDIRYSMSDAQVTAGTAANYGVLAASFTEEFEIVVDVAKAMYFASVTAGTKVLFRRWS